MSLPRPVVAGATIIITRRCTQRQFLLRPSSAVNGIIGYFLAVVAERYGLRLHAFCAMSNHLCPTARRGQGAPTQNLVRARSRPQQSLSGSGLPASEF